GLTDSPAILIGVTTHATPATVTSRGGGVWGRSARQRAFQRPPCHRRRRWGNYRGTGCGPDLGNQRSGDRCYPFSATPDPGGLSGRRLPCHTLWRSPMSRGLANESLHGPCIVTNQR